MKRLGVVGALVAGAGSLVLAQPAVAGDSALLSGSYDLARERSQEEQYFQIESRMVTHAPDGRAVDTKVFRVRLRCVPGPSVADGDRYTCLGFTVQQGDGPEVSIPSLTGWSYVFRHLPGERDASGRTLGIDHAPFEHLVDATGADVPAAVAYHVYNAFIDFHSFQIFTERTARGGGIQDLTRVGQKIIHAASHSRPATDLGGASAKGSYFENGEVTLELKGIGLEGGRPCALIGYDSGSSSFLMIGKPAPGVEVRTTGSSHYWGDIYKDLASLWIRRASLTELVVAETRLPGGAAPVDAVVERSILVRNVDPPVALAPR